MKKEVEQKTKKAQPKKATNKLTWEAIARQNTGSHFLDSGGVYGYKYNMPILKKPVLLGSSSWTDREGVKHLELETTINTVELLKSVFTIDQKLTKKLKNLLIDCNGSKGYQDTAELFISDILKRDDLEFKDCVNTYNHETDLDQVFQFSIIQPLNCLEWYYNVEQCFFIVETHNGCDVRSGYSDFIVCTIEDSDKALKLFDLKCGLYFSEGSLNGVKLTESELSDLNDPYHTGHSSSPVYEFNKEIEEILLTPDQEDKTDLDSVIVKLKSGHIITVHAEAAFNY